MTRDEAIEILRLYEHAAGSIPRADFLQALQLGIEALKRVKAKRYHYPHTLGKLLPGETEEVK